MFDVGLLDIPKDFRWSLTNLIPTSLVGFVDKMSGYEMRHQNYYCGRQEEPAILIPRLLLRMRRMNVASIRLDFN